MEPTQNTTTPQPIVAPQPINTPPAPPQYMTVESSGKKKMIAVFALSFLMITGAAGVFLFMYAQSSSKASEMFQYSMRKGAASISVAPSISVSQPVMSPTPVQSQTVDDMDVSDTQVDKEMGEITSDVNKL